MSMTAGSWLGRRRAIHGFSVLAMTKSLSRKSSATESTMTSAPRHVLCLSRHHTATMAIGIQVNLSV